MNDDIDTIYFPEPGPEKEWKIWQNSYFKLMEQYAPNLPPERQVVHEEKVDLAMFFITQQADYSVYPAKSRMVAIIYACLINQVYGDDFYSTLDDPELLGGKDPHFVPYSEDRKTYDAIIDILRGLPDWIEGGWGPRTRGEFYLRCTKQGIEKITSIICE